MNSGYKLKTMLKQIPFPNRHYIKAYKEAFKKSKIHENIKCLIVHGSSLFKPFSNDFSDIDLELVLKKHSNDDYKIIKEIIQNSSVPTECQLRYTNELTDPKGLIQYTKYKIFMYFAYSNGITLIGNNIYKDLCKKIDDKTAKFSLLLTAQIYFKDIRKSFFANSHPYIVNKNIMRTLFDLCLFLDLIDYKKLGTKEVFELETISCVNLIIDRFKNVLSDSDIKTLLLFQKKFQKLEYCIEVIPIVEFLIYTVSVREKNSIDSQTLVPLLTNLI